LALSCYAVVLIGVFFGDWPLWSLLVFITIPMPVLSFRAGWKNLGKWAEFFPAIKTTILMNFLYLIILSVSYLV
jgi:1,4-dihydroxy-2-naphthoate octaprenyltransferase